MTIRTADIWLCLGWGERAEHQVSTFESVVDKAKFGIIPSTSWQQWKFTLHCFNFVFFSADLEAREREAQTRDSEEEEIRITRTLEQEVMITFKFLNCIWEELLKDFTFMMQTTWRDEKLCSSHSAFWINGLCERGMWSSLANVAVPGFGVLCLLFCVVESNS